MPAAAPAASSALEPPDPAVAWAATEALHHVEEALERERLHQGRIGVDPAQILDRRHRDDRDRREHLVGTLKLTEPPAIHDRHHQVEQDDARASLGLAELLKSLAAVLGRRDAVPRVLQDLGKAQPQFRIVLHDEDRLNASTGRHHARGLCAGFPDVQPVAGATLHWCARPSACWWRTPGSPPGADWGARGRRRPQEDGAAPPHHGGRDADRRALPGHFIGTSPASRRTRRRRPRASTSSHTALKVPADAPMTSPWRPTTSPPGAPSSRSCW